MFLFNQKFRNGRRPRPALALPQRRFFKPPWCGTPGAGECTCTGCGAVADYAGDASAPGAPAPLDPPLPSTWYGDLSPAAVAFWLRLVRRLGLRRAKLLARDALNHGLTLGAFHSWCADRGFEAH